MSAKAPKTTAVTKPYEPTQREKVALDAHRARKREKLPSPDLKAIKVGAKTSIEPDHPDYDTGTLLLMASMGTTSPYFLNGLLNQLTNAGSQGREADPDGINFMMSVVKGIEPKDEIEAMLAAQMAAVHMASMRFARRLALADTIPQQDSTERAFNKLTRTFATQMEALKRYRTGGQQKMTVEHVTVQAGGQAIVGNVSHPGGGRPPRKEETTP